MFSAIVPFVPDASAIALPGSVRARDVLRFNAPLPAIAGTSAAAGLIIGLLPLPRLVRIVGALGAISALQLLVTATAATLLVFDRSGLTRYDWLREALGRDPRRWVNLTTGFDDT